MSGSKRPYEEELPSRLDDAQIQEYYAFRRKEEKKAAKRARRQNVMAEQTGSIGNQSERGHSTVTTTTETTDSRQSDHPEKSRTVQVYSLMTSQGLDNETLEKIEAMMGGSIRKVAPMGAIPRFDQANEDRQHNQAAGLSKNNPKPPPVPDHAPSAIPNGRPSPSSNRLTSPTPSLENARRASPRLSPQPFDEPSHFLSTRTDLDEVIGDNNNDLDRALRFDTPTRSARHRSESVRPGQAVLDKLALAQKIIDHADAIELEGDERCTNCRNAKTTKKCCVVGSRPKDRRRCAPCSRNGHKCVWDSSPLDAGQTLDGKNDRLWRIIGQLEGSAASMDTISQVWEDGEEGAHPETNFAMRSMKKFTGRLATTIQELKEYAQESKDGTDE